MRSGQPDASVRPPVKPGLRDMEMRAGTWQFHPPPIVTVHRPGAKKKTPPAARRQQLLWIAVGSGVHTQGGCSVLGCRQTLSTVSVGGVKISQDGELLWAATPRRYRLFGCLVASRSLVKVLRKGAYCM